MNRAIIIKITKNGTTYSNVDGYQTAGTTLFGLSAGSASIERILCDKQLEFGVCNSAKFEARIFNIATDVTDCQIEVLASDVTDPIFVGKIDSSKKDETNEYRDIVAYDNLYTARDKDIAEAWNGTGIWENENPITLKTLRNKLCVAAGLTVSTSQPTLPNDNESIPAKFATFTSAKFSTIIKMVCELQGSFPIVTADGKIKFIQLTTSATDITDNCDTNESEFEDYETSPIDAINVYSTSNDLTQTVGASDPTNAYPISGNIFLLSFDATFVTRVLQAALSTISQIVYTPATLELIIGDLSLQIGDCVKIYRAGNQYIHYVFGTTLYDSLLVRQSINCPATGSKLDESSSATNDPLIFGEKFTKLEQTVDGIRLVAESKNAIYRQDTAPSIANKGDLWYCTRDSSRYNIGKWYYYTGTIWQETTDKSIDDLGTDVNELSNDVSDLSDTVAGHTAELITHTSELSTHSTEIAARVTQTGHNLDQTFSWSLTAAGFVLKSGDTAVFTCSEGGIVVNGTIYATAGSIGDWFIDELNPTNPDGFKGIYKKAGVDIYGTGMAAKVNNAENVAFWAGYQGATSSDVTPWTGGSGWSERCSFYVTDRGDLHCDSITVSNIEIGNGTATFDTAKVNGLFDCHEIRDPQLLPGMASPRLTMSASTATQNVKLVISTDISGFSYEVSLASDQATLNFPVSVKTFYKRYFNKTIYSLTLTIPANTRTVTAPVQAIVGFQWAAFSQNGSIKAATISVDTGNIRYAAIGPSTIDAGYDYAFCPRISNRFDLGTTTRKWRDVITTSTTFNSWRKAKKDIAVLENKNDVLFDNLIPRTYKFVQNESDRTHYGFVLDEVRDAMDAAGIDPQDFAAYTLADPDNPDGDGGLRYTEFIPLNTWQIQKLKARVAELERRLNDGQ